VNLTNAGGAVTTVDLYEQLPPDARPAPGTELDFAAKFRF